MDDQLQKAKDAAYRYLSYRARSVAEVRGKLTEKDFAAEVVAEVVSTTYSARSSSTTASLPGAGSRRGCSGPMVRVN